MTDWVAEAVAGEPELAETVSDKQLADLHAARAAQFLIRWWRGVTITVPDFAKASGIVGARSKLVWAALEQLGEQRIEELHALFDAAIGAGQLELCLQELGARGLAICWDEHWRAKKWHGQR